MTLLEYALDAHRRGFAVFPCKPKSKKPASTHGCHDATRNPEQIKSWWTANPHYNPGIHCDTITVLDVDAGVPDINAARQLVKRLNLPRTFIVRSGRRDSFGMHIYFSGVTEKGPYEYNGIKGDLRSYGYYVVGPGGIHDVSGEAYTILVDAPLAPLPDIIRKFKVAPRDQQWAANADGRVAYGNRQRYLFETVDFHWTHGVRNRQALEKLAYAAWEHGCDHDPAHPKDVGYKIPELVGWFFKLPNLQPSPHIRSDRWVVYQLERDPQAHAAWNGQLNLFNNNSEDALRCLWAKIVELREGKVYQDQIDRIVKASPLFTHLGKDCPAFIPDGNEGLQ